MTTQVNSTVLGTLGNVNVTGNVLANTVTAWGLGGTITTASQTNITTVGTLGNLTVTGNVTANGNISTTGYFLGNAALLSGIIPVSAGGTGRDYSGSTGEIQFASNTGVLTSSVLLSYEITSGRLGVGTSGPGDKVTALTLDGVDVNFRAQNANSLAKFGIDYSGNLQIYAHTGKAQIFYTNGGVERMRIESAGNVVIAGSISANVAGYSIGYRDLPQVTAGNVTLALTDAGKHYYSTSGAPQTITVPSNANVTFPLGTTIVVINRGSGNISVAKQVEVSMYLAGNSVSATKTLTSYGMATLVKTETNVWFISGTGVV
jgi:hypothetical protein